MSVAGPRGPVVIDTDVFSADLVPGSRLAELYAPIIAGRPALISFQTSHGVALRRSSSRLGDSTDAQARRQDPARRGRPHGPGSCAGLRSAASRTARPPATHSLNASTMRTAGLPPRRFASRFLWSPTTRSSAACPASGSNRSRTPEHTTVPRATAARRVTPCAKLSPVQEPFLQHPPREADVTPDPYAREVPRADGVVDPARLHGEQRCRLVGAQERAVEPAGYGGLCPLL